MSVVRSRGVSAVQGFLMYRIHGDVNPDFAKCPL